MRYYIVSLGCPKNTVDAEGICHLLNSAGHQPVDEPDQADILLVNTCGFIAPARAESLHVLRDLAKHKRPGQRLVATGCLSQRDGTLLARQVRGLDGVLGTRRWAEILTLIEQVDRRRAGKQVSALVGDPAARLPSIQGQTPVSRTAVQGRCAYLQVADGCSAPCAFCAIPLIKGPLRSRPANDILADARRLAVQGIQEIMLIAQDTTAYGRDQGQTDALPDLLDALIAAVPQVPWIRLMYAYPQHISQRMIDTMARHEQIVHYLDLPLQHAHPDVLKRMCRPANVERVRHLIEDLRKAMPDIALRTSFIVGYPGETEAEFRALEAFIQDVQFDKVGVFIYSPEQGTAAFDLPDRLPAPVQEERYARLMERQQAISLARNEAQVGRTLDVLIEGEGEIEPQEPEDGSPSSDALEDGTETTISIGRSYRDAPEIDGLVLVEGAIEPGQMVRVQINGAMEYDLFGIPVQP